MSKNHTLTIFHWNINNMSIKWDQLLAEAHHYDIFFIQEFNYIPISMTSSLQCFEANGSSKKRDVTLISSKSYYRYNFTQICPKEFSNTGDVVIVFSQKINKYFINIYNDPSSTTLSQLSSYLEHNSIVRENCVLSGDFNAHHPFWETHSADRCGKYLFQLMLEHELKFSTPKDLGTFCSPQTINDTTIDF